MNKAFLAIALGLSFLLAGCLEDSLKSDRFLVRVNDYKINSGDIDSLLKHEMRLDSNFHITDDAKIDFIENLIETQVLLQEAKKRKIDQNERFRQTIQRYWESTLIRELLTEKVAQLRKATIVSQKEVEEYYRRNKDLFNGRSLEELKPDLQNLLEEQKVSAWLKEWIEDLKIAADVEIKDAELAAKLQRNRVDD